MNHWLAPDEPATYQIRVQGYVSQQLADNFGLSVDRITDPTRAVTTLSGPVLDQAALMGILNSLYGMGFSLLSVECQSLSNKTLV